MKNSGEMEPYFFKSISHDSDSENTIYIFCIHSIFGDAALDYMRLASTLEPQYKLIGIDAKYIESVESHGKSIANSILLFRAKYGLVGPIIVLGYSSGGHFALSAAEHLIQKEFTVFTHVIDTASPYLYQQLSMDKLALDLTCLAKKIDPSISIPLTELVTTNGPHALIDDILSRVKTYKKTEIVGSIRHAVHNFLPDNIPPFSFYQASRCLFVENGVLDVAPDYLCWPKDRILNPQETQLNGNHFSIIKNPTELARKLKENILQQLKYQSIDELPDDFLRHDFYVSPDATLNDERLPLSNVTSRFLKSRYKKLLIVKGPSGIGKSIYTNCLGNILSLKDIAVIRIDLSDQYSERIIQNIQKLTTSLDKNAITVIILDAYDEQAMDKEWLKLYVLTKLPIAKDCKFIVTYRSELLVGDYKSQYIGDIDPIFYQETQIKPLTKTQISEFIEIEIQRSELNLTFQEAEEYLDSLPDISELIQNPLLLRYILTVKDDLAALLREDNALRITPYLIYTLFTNKIARRIVEKKQNASRPCLGTNQDHLQCKVYMQNIALLFMQSNMNTITIDFSEENEETEFLVSLFDSDTSDKCSIGYDIKEIFSPSLENELEYKITFKHKSLKDYLCAEALKRILSGDLNESIKTQATLAKYSVTPNTLVRSDRFKQFWWQASQTSAKFCEKLLQYVHQTQ